MQQQKPYLRFVSAGLIVLTSYAALGQKTTGIYKQKFNASVQLENQVGYAQAVKADNILYISGTLAAGDMAAQIREVMESIKTTLQAYGASFQNVTKETVYTTNLDSFILHKDIRRNYYNNDFPATTWVEVKRLYLPQFSVAIEVTAHLPH